jgi:hypothetical protein
VLAHLRQQRVSLLRHGVEQLHPIGSLL